MPEFAHRRAEEWNLCPALVEYIGQDFFDRDFTDNVCELMLPEDEKSKERTARSFLTRLTISLGVSVTPCPPDAIRILVKYLHDPDVGPVGRRSITILLRIIANQNRSEGSAGQGLIPITRSVFSDLVSCFQDFGLTNLPDVYSLMRKNLIECFGGLALNDRNVQGYSTKDDKVKTMLRWINAKTSQPDKAICALVFFGNIICKSDEVIVSLIRLKGCQDDSTNFPDRLSEIISVLKFGPLLTSALDVVQNLAARPKKRKTVAEMGILDALVCCWSIRSTNMQMRCKALYQTRQLLQLTSDNVYTFLEKEVDVWDGIGVLPITILLSSREQADYFPLRVEIGRTLAEIWRTAHSFVSISKDASESALEDLLIPVRSMTVSEIVETNTAQEMSPRSVLAAIARATSMHADIAEPLIDLIRSQNASLVTEGWFGMALMAKEKYGACRVHDSLYKFDALDTFRSTLHAQDGDSKDKANATLLLSNLIDNIVSMCTPCPRSNADLRCIA